MDHFEFRLCVSITFLCQVTVLAHLDPHLHDFDLKVILQGHNWISWEVTLCMSIKLPAQASCFGERYFFRVRNK